MALDDLSRYIYGTTRLGDEKIPLEERIAVTRAAMDAGIWFHTSHQYGNALNVEREAFDQDRAKTPRAIFKIGWSSIEEIRGQVEEQIAAVGASSMAVGQLCLGGGIAEDFMAGGSSIDGLNALRSEGPVGRYVLETWPWNSQIALGAIQGGHWSRLIEGLIFYLNPLQRFVTNELWDLLVERNVPIVAMRTVSGGDVHRIAEIGPEYLRPRAQQMIPLYKASGCGSWPEFCVRFVHGFPQVKATVGATSHPERLREFVSLMDAPPLHREIHEQVVALQRRWSDEHDRHAKPWSM